MKDQFCDYEISFDLKELGYKKICFGVYIDEFIGWSLDYLELPINSNDAAHRISAPLIQQAVEWLDGQGIYLIPDLINDGLSTYWLFYINRVLYAVNKYPSRREATIAAIKEAIKILKEENNV